jgi:hypothetical protein
MRVVPFLTRIGKELPLLLSVKGVEERAARMMLQERRQPDSSIFELLVALAYRRRGWSRVEFVPETPGRGRSPDMQEHLRRRAHASGGSMRTILFPKRPRERTRRGRLPRRWYLTRSGTIARAGHYQATCWFRQRGKAIAACIGIPGALRRFLVQMLQLPLGPTAPATASPPVAAEDPIVKAEGGKSYSRKNFFNHISCRYGGQAVPELRPSTSRLCEGDAPPIICPSTVYRFTSNCALFTTPLPMEVFSTRGNL